MSTSKNIQRYFAPLCASSALAAALTIGCTSETKDTNAQPPVTAKGAALHQATDCGDLLTQIQSDAIAKLSDQVAIYSDQLPLGQGRDLVSSVTGSSEGPVAFEAGAEESQGDASQGDGDALSSGLTAQESDNPPTSHSSTNTQEQDVDEADIVKISDDGLRMFVLHGNSLKIVDAWPADTLAQTGETKVPGSPLELFIAGNQAIVFSSVAPEGLAERKANGDSSLGIVDGCYYGGASFVQISVYDVSGSSPRITREMIFEGNYVSSRLHDEVVRAVVRGGFAANDLYYPSIDYYDSFGREKSEERLKAELDNWRDQVELDIRSTTLADWVPRRFEERDGEWSELPTDCDSYYVPEPGLVEGGVTQVVSFDTAANEAPQVTSVLGGAQTVYANREALVVAQTDWRWDSFRQGEGTRTSLHAFSINGEESNYDGSGFVPGYLINQFALSQREGVIFAATTEDVFDDPESDSRSEPKNTIVTLALGESGLSQLDRTEDLGEPGETIFAVRFLGDRAYVVTFEQTDPLYAIDISDPADMVVLGELHIPGFSNYIHPLGETSLLTIGQETEGGEESQGVALQIFDVSDATSPQLAHKETFGGFSYSEANSNHKAFTFVDGYFDDGDSLLLFPLVSYEPQYISGLEVVKVGVESGFEKLGTIDHAALINADCDGFSENLEPCYYYYGEEMRRGLQIDDYIYALSQGGVTVHAVAELSSQPIASLEFATPEYEQCIYYGDGDGDVASDGPEPDFIEVPEEVAREDDGDGGTGEEASPDSMGTQMGGAPMR